MAEHTQVRRLGVCQGPSFTWVLDWVVGMLYMCYPGIRKKYSDAIVNGSVGYSDHEMTELEIQRGRPVAE